MILKQRDNKTNSEGFVNCLSALRLNFDRHMHIFCNGVCVCVTFRYTCVAHDQCQKA